MTLLSPRCQLFAFSRRSQRNWEVRRPASLLAEAGSRRLYHRGTEVSSGFSSFDWPSPEQWGSNLHIEACWIAPASGVMWKLGHSLSEQGVALWEVLTALCVSHLPGSGHWVSDCICRKKKPSQFSGLKKYNASCFYCEVEGGTGDHPGSDTFMGLN